MKTEILETLSEDFSPKILVTYARVVAVEVVSSRTMPVC